MQLELALDGTSQPSEHGRGILECAADFCTQAPYKEGAYGRRNWGAPLHSLCSYQGKLKPSIAHYLVKWFTQPGDRVLDPLSGVGTIPLEARRQNRIGLASDLSPLADTVCRAKLEPFEASDVQAVASQLTHFVRDYCPDELDLAQLTFGLNGAIRDYFHPDTARDILAARKFFVLAESTVAVAVVKTALLHILHGNRPYALSRNSHPITPFAPTGPTVYKSLIHGVNARLEKVVPELLALREFPDGISIQADFRKLPFEPVDAVITSPPFSKSLRFWSSNWMRLWLAGWNPEDFKSQPAHYLEKQQDRSLDVYSEFGHAMRGLLKNNGRLVMHLGQTAKVNMAESIVPLLAPYFDIQHIGRECVRDTESHGLSDKGATVAHWYLFAEAR